MLAGALPPAGTLPPAGESPRALEVLLRTSSYFSVIDDDVMRSYRLVSVRQQ